MLNAVYCINEKIIKGHFFYHTQIHIYLVKNLMWNYVKCAIFSSVSILF